ncbi:type II toxin-antitoxin system Rv0910 family toxin [Nocardioides lianchengensis]|uniref:Acetyl-CoA C-acetyltransferase n=1 Tax=Nocardioides lianchengensis TaxID=1045774 RepID=A0A1G6PP08_9ACTN|nr:crotonase/enoyl-CoA hydratase family protein [Nocardioides lianchengensis]NYG11929.1 acetyl-CoA C-acetyltransferase [Nocardioides lianchengensis]SDC81982.1 acetyl-CoA C-acetyltransferase [Nocardioides lianchengensis]
MAKLIRTARTLVSVARAAVSTRSGVGAVREGGPDVPPPAGLEAFARQVSATRLLPAPPEVVAEAVLDLDRTADWLTLHAAWRGERPDRLRAGEEFTQQIRLMDIPAQARWSVEAAGPDGFALRGTGPMGIVIGLWCTLAPAEGGTAVRLDGGLDGAPVRGPVGLTAVRSVEVALAESLAALEQVVSGGGARLRLSRDPVRHHASGRELDPRTPVIVGVGQLVQRKPDLSTPREPVALSVEALRGAVADSGATADLLAQADLVYAVPSASWTYGNQAGRVAELVGVTQAGTVQSSPYGGDGAQLVVNDAAQQVVDGHADVVLLTGAEAGATVAALQVAGRTPDWPRVAEDERPDRVIGVDRPANNEAETAVGLGAPIYAYALVESALRGRAGTSYDDHRATLGRLWSRLSEVAARNPFAWDPTARTAAEVADPTPGNRWVSDPYTKLMCANLQVDLATGIVLTSVAAAEAAGVPQEKWVFVHAGASATDEWFVSERADLATSPAIAAAGAAVLDHAGLAIEDVDLVDLYSCFPAAVQLGAHALGLPLDDPDRPLSVTGGLTFGGGPGNNYGSHAIATMVPLLRAAPERVGLSTSLGWYATKHAIGVYAATPPARAYAHLTPAFERPAPRPVRTSLDGSGVVEAVTRPFDRDGTAEAAILSVIADDGARVLLRIEDGPTLGVLDEADLLRTRVTYDGSGLTVDTSARLELPAPPPAPVRTSREGAVAVITLDRPEVRNAIDHRTAVALERALDDAEADPAVRVLVLTGAGDHFCAGMDLAAANRGELPITDGRGPLGITARPPTKPLVVAVEGAALAGGFELMLCGDLVVAADGALMGLPEARRGMVAAAGGLLRIGTRLPRAVALELALTGEPLPASRLHELGLVNRVVPPGTALDVALGLAASIAASAPLSVAVGKRIVDDASSWSAEEGFERQTELATPVMLSDDAREGVAAFAEKRTPVWTGR